VIPASFVQDLLSRIDIAEVVGKQVTLKKAGINLKGLCPFHGEKTPSFSVSPSRQTYHCFGCGAHGDAIRFLVEHAGLSFVEAVHELASNLGLTVPNDAVAASSSASSASTDAKPSNTEARPLFEVLSQAATHYKKQLKQSSNAIDYLKKRGLTGEIAAKFWLGYAPPHWRGLASVFPSYDDPVLEKAGLVIAHSQPEDSSASTGTNTQKRYDRFRGRIMFPIRNLKGDILGFGARVLDNEEPKYLNSPETPVFSKGRELYGLFEARQSLRKKGYALVTEGYMDVVALSQMGIDNAVATLGTACTAEHVQKLLRFTDKIIFSFDGDSAGRKAASRALEASLPHATDTRHFSFLFLPPEHDPDSFIRAFGKDAFDTAIAQAVPLSQQLIAQAKQGCENLQIAENRAKFLAQARTCWLQLPTGLFKTQVLDELARTVLLSSSQLENAWLKASSPPPSTPASSPLSSSSLSSASSASSASSPPASFPAFPRPPKQASVFQTSPTKSLERIIWLMLHWPYLWHELNTESQHLLAEQEAPYGAAFVWIEQCCNESQAPPPSLLDVANSQQYIHALHPDVQTLLANVSALLPPGDDHAANPLKEVEQLLHRLEENLIRSRLQLLAALEPSGPSAETKTQIKMLLDRLSALNKPFLESS
jgi:DNA primase